MSAAMSAKLCSTVRYLRFSDERSLHEKKKKNRKLTQLLSGLIEYYGVGKLLTKYRGWKLNSGAPTSLVISCIKPLYIHGISSISPVLMLMKNGELSSKCLGLIV